MKAPYFSPEQKKYAAQLKRTIKTAQHKLAMDDYTYRLILKRVSQELTGKEKDSCTLMSIEELKAVIEHMRKLGFKKKVQSSVSRGLRPDEDLMLKKIQTMWKQMYQKGIVRDGSEQALNQFARTMINRIREANNNPLVLNLLGATRKELSMIIEALKSWEKRVLSRNNRRGE